MSGYSSYKFVTEWTVQGTLGEVSSILKDVEAFPRWWRPIYISATVLDAGDQHGVGRLVALATRGFLPYVLRWQLRVVESREPYGFTVRASGDLVGVGVWELRQDGTCVKLQLGWTVSVQKTVVRLLSFVLRPVFSKNHAWAMAKGRIGLQAEIRRQRLESDRSFAGQL